MIIPFTFHIDDMKIEMKNPLLESREDLDMMRFTKKSLICYVHDDIILLCDDLLSLNIKEKTKLKQLISRVNKIRKFTERAKEMGQKMEDRLNEYKDKISELGYVRKK